MIYRCTYHIVWTPRYRYRVLEGLVKELLQKDIPMLLEWKSSEMIELNIQKDHVHLIASVPPNILISQLMGILKGKTAIKIFKSYPQLRTKPYGAIISGQKVTSLAQLYWMKIWLEGMFAIKKKKNVRGICINVSSLLGESEK